MAKARQKGEKVGRRLVQFFIGGGGRMIEPKIGQRIELIYTNDPHVNLKPGDQGTVGYVDGIGRLHVEWDNGEKLTLVPDTDKWKVL